MLKKIILTVLMLLVMSGACFAAEYRNEEYNFKIMLPDQWQDSANKSPDFLVDKEYFDTKSGDVYKFALLTLKLKLLAMDDTMDTLEPELKKEFSGMIVKSFTDKLPTAQLISTKYVKAGKHSTQVTKFKTENNTQTLIAIVLLHQTFYCMAMTTTDQNYMDNNKYLDIVKTLKPLK